MLSIKWKKKFWYSSIILLAVFGIRNMIGGPLLLKSSPIGTETVLLFVKTMLLGIMYLALVYPIYKKNVIASLTATSLVLLDILIGAYVTGVLSLVKLLILLVVLIGTYYLWEIKQKKNA